MNNKGYIKICLVICLVFVFCFQNIYTLNIYGASSGNKTPGTSSGNNTPNYSGGTNGQLGSEINGSGQLSNGATSGNTGNTGTSTPVSGDGTKPSGNFFDDIFGQAGGFFNPTNPSKKNENETPIGEMINKKIDEMGIVGALAAVGNLIIIIITAILGVKYLFAVGANEKADIKNGLITLCIAAVFFFGAQTVVDFSQGIMKDAMGSASDFETIEQNVWATVKVVVNTCCIIGIVLIGIKYMFAAPDRKADIKAEVAPMLVGLVLAYAGVNFLTFVFNISQEMMGVS